LTQIRSAGASDATVHSSRDASQVRVPSVVAALEPVMQDILVHTDTFSRPWAAAVEYAARLAAALRASLTAAYVYPSPLYTAPRCSSPALIDAIWNNARTLEAEAKAACDPFIRWSNALGVARSTWHVAESHVPDALAEIGTWHDLLVLDLDDRQTWGSPTDVATLVLASQLPCIAVPRECRNPELDCVLLAWNGAPEAVRAVHSALPLLAMAKRVVLLRGRPRNSASSISWKPPFEIGEHLARHGIAFDERDFDVADDDAGAALLETAGKTKADLIVMGAYGHTRFHEWALGGATRHVLHHARVPVFMRH
jgi:nucleotide-binding universal stress UspA family protein